MRRRMSSLKAFDSLYQEAYAAGMGRKLGFARPRDGDQALIQELLHRMAEHQADFTATFRALCEASTDPSRDADVRALFSDPTAYDAWAQRWRARLAQEDDAPEFAPHAHAVGQSGFHPAQSPHRGGDPRCGGGPL